ncbi:SCO family protein [Nocardioides limicola]|uniref:SCO family protein n=1 Tax=Nocardioides limicola TaxID=2803368 RepID=UPI00193BC6D7|nr:SCO family protein [Nocardioides sp. DJM-14]
MRDRLRLLVASIVVVLVAACSGTTSPTVLVGDDGFHGTLLDDTYPAPDTALVDTDGAPFSLAADLEAPVSLVFFGYTQCPDICQNVMSALASAQVRLPAEHRDDVQLVFVTTDPERDDPQTLRGYLDRYAPGIVGLTGEQDVITVTARQLAVHAERVDSDTQAYEIDHTASVIALTGGEGVLVWSHTTSAAEFAEDVALLLARTEEMTR